MTSDYNKGYQESLLEIENIEALNLYDKLEQISYYEERINEEKQLNDSYSKGYCQGLQERINFLMDDKSKQVNFNNIGFGINSSFTIV